MPPKRPRLDRLREGFQATRLAQVGQLPLQGTYGQPSGVVSVIPTAPLEARPWWSLMGGFGYGARGWCVSFSVFVLALTDARMAA
jgi:hypothetical protein